MFGLFEKNYAYAASTLPIAILNKMAKDWNIGKVLVASTALGKSFSYLKKENPSIEIIVLPQSSLLNILYLIAYLCAIRISKRKIYFFHECCCIYFDLLVGIVKPFGFLYPQVTLNSFEKIDFSEANPSKSKSIINLLSLDKVFIPYLVDRDDERGKIVIWSRVKYPSTVIQYSHTESNKIKSFDVQCFKGGSRVKILFLVGSEVFDNNAIRCLYIKTINICAELGFQCYVKDHPNPRSRLLLMHPQLIEIDPYMPIELSADIYDFVVGIASTGLLQFKSKSISILHLINSADLSLVERRKKHITAMQYGHFINFPKTFVEFFDLLRTNDR